MAGSYDACHVPWGRSDETGGAAMTSEQKREALRQLARKRQADRLEPYYCLADIHDGYYECDYVSPWTTSAENVNADLMILGKDWGSTDSLIERPPDPERKRLGQGWGVPTNKNLREYLNDCMGGLKFSETYASNVFPFIKQGKKDSGIRDEDMLYAAKKYALPQIEIVSPRMVICLGKPAFRAVRRAAGFPDIAWEEAIAPTPHIIISGAETYGVSHPSKYPGGKSAVKQVWKQLGDRLEKLRKHEKLT
jgi:uracil-DNA glycosylase